MPQQLEFIPNGARYTVSWKYHPPSYIAGYTWTWLGLRLVETTVHAPDKHLVPRHNVSDTARFTE